MSVNHDITVTEVSQAMESLVTNKDVKAFQALSTKRLSNCDQLTNTPFNFRTVDSQYYIRTSKTQIINKLINFAFVVMRSKCAAVGRNVLLRLECYK